MAISAIAQGGRPTRPTHPTLTENMWALMQRCWDQNPDLRSDVSGVLQALAESVSCSFGESTYINLAALWCTANTRKVIPRYTSDNKDRKSYYPFYFSGLSWHGGKGGCRLNGEQAVLGTSKSKVHRVCSMQGRNLVWLMDGQHTLEPLSYLRAFHIKLEILLWPFRIECV